MKQFFSFALGVSICLGIGMLSGLFITKNNLLWYSTLTKPSFSPPSWLFGPVWTIIYIMIGIALVLIWKQRPFNPTLFWFFTTNLLLNFTWTPLFFALHRIDLALFNIIFLLITLCACLILAYPNKYIILLLFPYFLWTSFATILNTQLFLLNY